MQRNYGTRELKSVSDACKRVNAQRINGAAVSRPPIWCLASRTRLNSMPHMSSTLRGGSNLAERLLAWLEPREDEMAALLAELVSIPTENPPGRNYRACANLLEKTLSQAGLLCERHEFPAPPANAEASPKASDEPPVTLTAPRRTGKPTRYFHGHYDVVPAQSPQQFHAARKEHF